MHGYASIKVVAAISLLIITALLIGIMPNKEVVASALFVIGFIVGALVTSAYNDW